MMLTFYAKMIRYRYPFIFQANIVLICFIIIVDIHICYVIKGIRVVQNSNASPKEEEVHHNRFLQLAASMKLLVSYILNTIY